ncbi:Uncharacterised protein [Mycobacteroides abscessus subsp. abscessus]|nr:Uncharacterised protein [Mycobacteroides abscessus subsp. abscessus]
MAPSTLAANQIAGTSNRAVKNALLRMKAGFTSFASSVPAKVRKMITVMMAGR